MRMETVMLSKLCFAAAFRIWRTDESFAQYPFGPPDRWFWPRIAWELYHFAIALEAQNGK